MAGHPDPLLIESPRGIRIATDKELFDFQHDSPAEYKKWSKHNRILYGKALIKSGQIPADAWREAFLKYPDGESDISRKSKFIIKKT